MNKEHFIIYSNNRNILNMSTEPAVTAHIRWQSGSGLEDLFILFNKL